MSLELPTKNEVTRLLKPLGVIEIFFTIARPFIFFVSFFFFCQHNLPFLAFISVVLMSFFTYPSLSHELVHQNLCLGKHLSQFLLSLLEGLMLRSGESYRLVHLKHHACFPHPNEDLEGRASYSSLLVAILSGVLFQIEVVFWGLKNGTLRSRVIITCELILIFGFIFYGVYCFNSYPYIIYFQVLSIMGSWIIPFMTSYLVHNPLEGDKFTQTTTFRGVGWRILALDHLYHLEHHLFPHVCHRRWPELAKILNPYLKSNALKLNRLGRKNKGHLNLN